MMLTLSQRLTRAGLTFIVLGTAAAVLPQQDNAAVRADGCTVNGHTLVLSSASGTTPTPSYAYMASASRSSSNIVFPYLDTTKVKDLSSYTETINYTNNSSAGSGINLTAYNGSTNGTPAGPGGGTGQLQFINSSYAFNFLESVPGAVGIFTVTLLYNGQTYIASATVSG